MNKIRHEEIVFQTKKVLKSFDDTFQGGKYPTKGVSLFFRFFLGARSQLYFRRVSLYSKAIPSARLVRF